MSHIFYDRLVSLDKIDKELSKIVESKEEREELWHIIDEYVHHRMMGCILHNLPHHHHEEFLSKFVSEPHHEGLFSYLKEKISHDFEDFLRREVEVIKAELLEIVQGDRKKLKAKKK